MEQSMINGAHVLLYSRDPDADRAFLREVLSFPSVDVGHGWLIFALLPAEIAVHPVNSECVQGHGAHRMLGAILYLLCDEARAEAKAREGKGVSCASSE